MLELAHSERVASGIAFNAARPVLLIDEVQDLVKDERLARVGGRLVFKQLAVLMVAYGVDRQTVSTVVAGSSASLIDDLDTTVARGNRWKYYELKDPSENVVLSALVERGYSGEEARSLIGLCGTRLRLLQEPLQQHCNVTEFLSVQRLAVVGQISKLFAGLSPEDRVVLSRILDLAAAAAADGDATLSSSCPRPTLQDLTPSLCKIDLSSLLFVKLGRYLTFQSRLQQHAWSEMRAAYVNPL